MTDQDAASAEPIWSPDATTIARSRIERYRAWLVDTGRADPGQDYSSLWAWSVGDLPAFWASIWDFFDIRASAPYADVLVGNEMPGAQWFTGAELNYVDQVLRHGDPISPAVIAESEPGGPAPLTLTWGELRRQVAAVAATLRGLGVGRGDRVVGYLPDIAEAVVAFLATASLGAVWSACGQDYAPTAVVDRFGQLDPVVLFTADGYRYGGKDHDRRDAIRAVRDGLGTLRATVVVHRLDAATDAVSGTLDWADVSAGDHALRTEQVPFDHPLWILFSSGTTGRPKGIVHGHGGVLLEHLKALGLHMDLGPDDVYFWYTSPSWMMWNYQVSGLLVGATIVCYDGSPSHPDPGALWHLAARHRVTALGTSPAYLQACEKAGVRPVAENDLSALRVLGATGSVVPEGCYRWVREAVGERVALASMTGGTDVVSVFAGAVPTVPIWAGELSAPYLGAPLDAWDESGRSVRDSVGELVVTRPMPSMPLFFWNDHDGSRYRSSYFDTYPGVWRHGDWITLTTHGSIVVHGRSDSTLNRNGIRIGSADIYHVVEQLPEVREALVIGAEQADGSYWMPLFVALTEGAQLDDDLRGRIVTSIRRDASPRHVPDEIIEVPGVPHTRTGKKLEVPVKRLIQGAALADVVDPDAVDDLDLLHHYDRAARARHATRGRTQERDHG